MSAFYAMTCADSVEVLTDGAVYLPDGTLIDITEKIWRSPSLPLAITGRGSMAFEAFAETILTMPEDSVDALIERTRSLLDQLNSVSLPCGACEVLIAGFSETVGPFLRFFTTADIYPQFEPFTLYDVGREFGGGNALSAVEVAGLPSPESGLAEVGPILFEVMRGRPGINPASPHLPAIYGIGGHIDLTVISTNGATTKRLHTWPDVVGQKISPAAESDTAAPFSDGSTYSDGSKHALSNQKA